MLFTLKREYGIILKYQINYFCSITHLKNQDGGMNLAIISLLTNQHFQSTSFCQLMISLMFSKLWIHNFYMNIEAYFCLRWKVKRLVFFFQILNKFLCIWWFSVQPKNLFGQKFIREKQNGVISLCSNDFVEIFLSLSKSPVLSDLFKNNVENERQHKERIKKWTKKK